MSSVWVSVSEKQTKLKSLKLNNDKDVCFAKIRDRQDLLSESGGCGYDKISFKLESFGVGSWQMINYDNYKTTVIYKSTESTSNVINLCTKKVKITC